MLRIRKRYNVSENNREKDTRGQRSESDVKVQDSIKIFKSWKQTSSSMNRASMNATEHLATTETRSHKKKKKRLRKRSVDSNDNNDDNADGSDDANYSILVAAKKAKIRNNQVIEPTNPIVQPTGNLRHTKSMKKLHSAVIEDSGRKKKKRKFDFDSNKIPATVLHQKSASDSIGERTESGTDSVARSSKSLLCDLQGMEDSVIDDYVSMNITDLCD